MNTRIIGFLFFLILVPALAVAGEDPAPATPNQGQASVHHGGQGQTQPASCCEVRLGETEVRPCNMTREMSDLMMDLKEQAEYRKLQAEIDAWEASINAEYE
ncbi:hypothetical protein KJ682_13360 [bacterium]|nr:hypothetical protein [bacterium]